ncbi:MAG: hypothetical protein ABL907_10355 [Hyphomicrobium sp.]
MTDAQAWLTVAGLAIDFFGFCLLLREWWIAFLSDQAMMAHEAQLEQQQRLRAFATQNANDAMKRHLVTAGQMQDDMAIRRARDDRVSAMRGRRRWFIGASVLIITGFVLQLLGAVPL